MMKYNEKFVDKKRDKENREKKKKIE